MGVLEERALDLVQIFSGHGSALVVKNTFLDVLTHFSDGGAQPALCRSLTAPSVYQFEAGISSASTSGNVTPRSLGSDPAADECGAHQGAMFSCNSPLSSHTLDTAAIEDAASPQVGFVGSSPEVHAASCSSSAEDDRPLREGARWGVQTRWGFVEFHWDEEEQAPGLRRSVSSPELTALPRQDGLECPHLKGAAARKLPLRKLQPETSTAGDAESHEGTASPCSVQWQAELGDSPVSWYPGLSPRGADTYVGDGNYSFFPLVQLPPFGVLDMDQEAAVADAAVVAAWQVQAPVQFPYEVQDSEQQCFGVDEKGAATASVHDECGRSVVNDKGGRRLHQGEVVQTSGSASNQGARQKASRSRSAVPLETEAWELLTNSHQAVLEGRSGSVWNTSCRCRDSSFLVQESISMLASQLSDASLHQDWGRCETLSFYAQSLLSDFHGHVEAALKHPHANHVLKVAVEKLPTELIAFVAMELSGGNKAQWAVTHSYGCRTVLRLAKHAQAGGWAGECVNNFIDEVLARVDDLCTDQFAKWVLEAILDNGLLEQRLQIVEALRRGMLRFATHKYASGLIERALQQCDVDLAATIVSELLSSRDAVCSLIRSQSGIYVLRDLASNPQLRATVWGSLLPFKAELQSNKVGRKLWESLSSPGEVPQ